ncbi:DUF5995 family protein [Brevundimonas sp.]|uniref:DUF5995 family protein n=1 Tax=Brevundimonas sp. TaxID=1871086 RepID=UPI003F6ED0BC
MDKKHLDPFDGVYASVTATMQAHARDRLVPPDQDWLQALIVAFAKERDRWETAIELAPYRRRWVRLRSKAMWLVAGAYLHIGYDLPRAMADNWPGTGWWGTGPNKDRAGRIFFVELETVFPDQLARTFRSHKLVGWPSAVSWLVTPGMFKAASLWVHSLRQGAWIHAEVLATRTKRALREAKMAEAIEAALADASDVFLWRTFNYRSPEGAVWLSPALAGLSVTSLGLAQSVVTGVVAAVVVLLLGAAWSRKRQEDQQLEDFVDLWGRLASEYLRIAVNTPDDFRSRRKRRRSLLGLPALEDIEGRRSDDDGPRRAD